MKEFLRTCPLCESDIEYKSKLSYKYAIKNQSVCRKCASTGSKNGMYGKSGDKNPFYGKKHSDETLKKQSNIKIGKNLSEETKDKLRKVNSGINNPMYGKTIYSVWYEKYGKDIADEKLIEYKDKQSKNNLGEKNSMFGKQSPMGSGNGWSGWYKNWYFRSLRELTYMIKIIERFNLNWVSGESNKYRIEYFDFNGNKRNYFPDFIINNKYIIESKPKKLWLSDNVIRKKNASIIFCGNNKMIYKLVDVGVISTNEIDALYQNGLIKFIDRYEKKYKQLFG